MQRAGSLHDMPARGARRRLAARWDTAARALRHERGPSALTFDDLGADCILDFLDDLEHSRGNSIRTRNARLSGIHSLFSYAALQAPHHMPTIQQVLAIPMKATGHRAIDFLDEREVEALLGGPHAHGSGGATTRCWLQVSRPGYAPPNWSACVVHGEDDRASAAVRAVSRR